MAWYTDRSVCQPAVQRGPPLTGVSVLLQGQVVMRPDSHPTSRCCGDMIPVFGKGTFLDPLSAIFTAKHSEFALCCCAVLFPLVFF